jgi:hypothetical protein
MGRLFETGGDVSARLMIDVLRLWAEGYRTRLTNFAAKKTLPVKWRGFCFVWFRSVGEVIKQYYYT